MGLIQRPETIQHRLHSTGGKGVLMSGGVSANLLKQRDLGADLGIRRTALGLQRVCVLREVRQHPLQRVLVVVGHWCGRGSDAALAPFRF